MFYLLYSYFSAGDHGAMPHYIPFLNLVRYLTFRTGMALVTAQLVIGLMARASSTGCAPSRAGASRSARRASSGT